VRDVDFRWLYDLLDTNDDKDAIPIPVHIPSPAPGIQIVTPFTSTCFGGTWP
jgi:hypothetical protein